MTGQEIQTIITHNNKRIFEILEPNIFELNKEVEELIEENKFLQNKCCHEFENKQCKFCGKEEEND